MKIFIKNSELREAINHKLKKYDVMIKLNINRTVKEMVEKLEKARIELSYKDKILNLMSIFNYRQTPVTKEEVKKFVINGQHELKCNKLYKTLNYTCYNKIVNDYFRYWAIISIYPCKWVDNISLLKSLYKMSKINAKAFCE